MTRARRIGCGSDRVADGGTPEVSESRGRGVANGEKPSGGARETGLKSRIDRSAGGRRGDDATIGRQPARDIVDTADGVARDRPGNRESVAPRGQGGASGRHFFLLRQRNLGEPIRPLGSGSAFNRRSASRRTRLSRSTARTCRRNLGRLTTPRVPRDASARVRLREMSQVRKVRKTITKPGLVVRSQNIRLPNQFGHVAFFFFFFFYSEKPRVYCKDDSPHAFFRRKKGNALKAQVVSSYRSHADHHDVPRLRRVQDSGGVAARARSARVPRTAARGCCHPVAVPPERASGEGARLRQSVFVRRSDDATKNRSIARTVTDASARVAEAEVTRKNDAASRHHSRWRASTSPEPLATERGLDDRKR